MFNDAPVSTEWVTLASKMVAGWFGRGSELVRQCTWSLRAPWEKKKPGVHSLWPCRMLPFLCLGHRKTKNTSISLSLADWRCRCFGKLHFFFSPLLLYLTEWGNFQSMEKRITSLMMHLVILSMHVTWNPAKLEVLPLHHLPFSLSSVLLSLIQASGCSLQDWPVYLFWNKEWSPEDFIYTFSIHLNPCFYASTSVNIAALGIINVSLKPKPGS